MAIPFQPTMVADHSANRPDVIERDGAASWVTRGANFVIVVTQARKGTRLRSDGIPDEHMILLPDAGASISAGTETCHVPGNHLIIVPPGECELVCDGVGHVVRCFSSRAEHFAGLARNAGDYLLERGTVAPISEWPAPSDGFRLRTYDLADGLVDGDKTRIYRSSNLMINILRERHEPRDLREMSPHSHEDFEQASITLRGLHVHHLRIPWGADMSVWRPDSEALVGSPSVTVIPPGVIHTTRNLGHGPALLVDVFCPPRADFSRQPGKVRNDADYPLPSRLARTL